MTQARTSGEPKGTPKAGLADALEGVVGGSAAQVVGRFVGMGFGFATTIVVSRYLGVSDYGRLSTALAFWAVFSLASEMGVTSVVAGEIAKPGADQVSVWAAGVSVQAAYSVLAIVLGLVGSALLFSQDHAMMIGVAIGAPLMFASLPAINSIHQVRLKMWIPAVLGVAQSALVFSLSVAAVVAHAQWQTFVVVAAISGVTVVAVNAWLGIREAGSHPTSVARLARMLAKTSAVVGLATLFETAYFKFDSVLVFRIAGAYQGGLYGAAYRLYELVLIVPTAVMSSAIPVAARGLHTDLGTLRSYNGRVTAVLTIAGLAAAVTVTLLSNVGVALVFGREFLGAGLLLCVLMPAAVARFVSIWHGSIVIAGGDRLRYLAVTASAAVVALSLDIALIPHFGALAAACVTAGTEVLVLTLMLVALGRRRRAAGGSKLIPLAVLGLGAWLLALVSSQSGASASVRLSAGLLAAGFVGGLVIYAARHGELRTSAWSGDA